jgi:cytochrome c5
LILTAENKGQVLFGRYCDSCHPGGEEGRGKSLISTQFLRDFQKDSDVTQLAREGTCIMPKFSRFLLADGDMGEVSKFVVSRAKASTQGASPLPPLDGASILGQRCANCHDGNNIPYINPRDPDTLKTLETEMATCAGLTVDQRKVLREYLLAEQSR